MEVSPADTGRPEILARGITDDDLERVGRRAARLLLDGAAASVSGVEVATDLVEGQVVAELLMRSGSWAVCARGSASVATTMRSKSEAQTVRDEAHDARLPSAPRSSG